MCYCVLQTCIIALNKDDMSKAFPIISCMQASDQKPEDSLRKV